MMSLMCANKTHGRPVETVQHYQRAAELLVQVCHFSMYTHLLYVYLLLCVWRCTLLVVHARNDVDDDGDDKAVV